MDSFRNRVENIKKENTQRQISELKKIYPDYDFEKAKDNLIVMIKENYLYHDENRVVIGITMDEVRDLLGDVLVGDFNHYLSLTENMHIKGGGYTDYVVLHDGDIVKKQ